ncbi:MAG: class I SAM-dependent methyltransferase [Phycisphaeraceae bacterium]|nr:MAG: class I SAM-dependent methyltransferase [Phycisphaeraceae bacterium]
MPDPATHNAFYNDASVYDVLHTPGTAEELDGLERAALRHVATRSRRQRWLEPACGSGRCVRLAAARGTPITGFDLNPEMIAYARARLKRAGLDRLARVYAADMRTFADEGVCEPASIDFAFNTINTFRHLMTDVDALAHLDQVHRVLRPGGVYAVGLSTCLYGCEQPTEDVWSARRGSLGVTQTVQYIPATGRRGGARVERVLSHLMIETPAGTDHRDSTYRLRTYSLEQWTDLIGRSGFDMIDTADHEGRTMDPTESGYRLYILGKPC